MLSVVNRGTQIAEETDEIPYKIINGNEPYEFRLLNSEITLNNIPTPIEIGIEPVVVNGYLSKEETCVMENITVVNVGITPTIKTGYTPITINPTVR